MRHVLITGAAGFIGSHLVDSLLADGWHVTAVDSFDPFYAIETKERNIAPHLRHPHYSLARIDIRDGAALQKLSPRYDAIVHLAARAGVRPSIADPRTYQEVNVAGTQNILELARQSGTPHVVFASSSSVYGVNPNTPWRESDYVLQPISPYASTKVSGELLGHVYSHLYGFRFIALRFFTVYGPRQRPDLAIHSFARKMLAGDRIPVFGDGTTRRDYTFISDIVSGIRGSTCLRPQPLRSDQPGERSHGHTGGDDCGVGTGTRREGEDRSTSRAAWRRAADLGVGGQGRRSAWLSPGDVVRCRHRPVLRVAAEAPNQNTP